jgi:hypothetical protein
MTKAYEISKGTKYFSQLNNFTILDKALVPKIARERSVSVLYQETHS